MGKRSSVSESNSRFSYLKLKYIPPQKQSNPGPTP